MHLSITVAKWLRVIISSSLTDCAAHPRSLVSGLQPASVVGGVIFSTYCAPFTHAARSLAARSALLPSLGGLKIMPFRRTLTSKRFFKQLLAQSVAPAVLTAALCAAPAAYAQQTTSS